MSYNRFLFYDSGFQQLSLAAFTSENTNNRVKSPFLIGDNVNKEENFLNSRAQETVGTKNNIVTGLNLQQSRNELQN
jgi:hypothetical protein